MEELMLSIVKAGKQHLEDCKAALLNSILGDIYFSNCESTEAFLTDGIRKGEIYVAINEEAVCTGFMRIESNFAFSGFPLLRAIAVKPEYRSKGIGGKLLEFYEQTGFEKSIKLFLFVSELNTRARKLYKEKEYVQVGSIPGFYAPGINELLLMKEKKL